MPPAAHIDSIARESKPEGTAVRGSIVILSSAGNTQITNFDGPAEFGERRAIQRLVLNRRQRGDERHADG